MKRTDPRHGTYAGWVQHQKEHKRPCRACREAHNAYMREYRSREEPGKRTRKQNNARTRALWRLARLYPDEYTALVGEELARR